MRTRRATDLAAIGFAVTGIAAAASAISNRRAEGAETPGIPEITPDDPIFDYDWNVDRSAARPPRPSRSSLPGA